MLVVCPCMYTLNSPFVDNILSGRNQNAIVVNVIQNVYSPPRDSRIRPIGKGCLLLLWNVPPGDSSCRSKLDFIWKVYNHIEFTPRKFCMCYSRYVQVMNCVFLQLNVVIGKAYLNPESSTIFYIFLPRIRDSFVFDATSHPLRLGLSVAGTT